MVDEARASALVALIRAAVGDMARYAAAVDVARFDADRDARNMVLHALYEGAQAAIDLAMHIVASEGLRPAAAYREAFESLRDAGWIDAALCARLLGWAGLRNVIAHGYVRLDTRIAVAALAERGDLEALTRAVAARLTTPGGR